MALLVLRGAVQAAALPMAALRARAALAVCSTESRLFNVTLAFSPTHSP